MGDLLHFEKPDDTVVREFADEVEDHIKEGRNVRGVIMICLYDDSISARAYSNERLTSVIGALQLAGQVIQDDYDFKARGSEPDG